MKNLLKISTIFMFIVLVFACKSKVEGEKAATGDAQAPATQTIQASVFKVDNGVLNWTGSKVGGTHQGTINVASGQIAVANGNIEAGTFVIDMNSITDSDLKAGDGKEKLEGHLKSPDFFDVGQFATATFEVTGVVPSTGVADVTHNVTGNLTIKGITKSISFPANIAISNGKLSAVSPAFVINRMDWNVAYGNASIVGLAKDKIISNDISLVLQLNASSAMASN